MVRNSLCRGGGGGGGGGGGVLSRLDAIVIIMLPLIFVIQHATCQYKAFIPAEMTNISLMTITKSSPLVNFDTNSS